MAGWCVGSLWLALGWQVMAAADDDELGTH